MDLAVEGGLWVVGELEDESPGAECVGEILRLTGACGWKEPPTDRSSCAVIFTGTTC